MSIFAQKTFRIANKFYSQRYVSIKKYLYFKVL